MRVTTRDPTVTRIVEAYNPKRRDLKSGRVQKYISIEERLLCDALEDGEWKGQRCFIIGGGPSLRGFDFSKLKGELVIGVNRAFERIDCQVSFSMDGRFYSWVTQDKLDNQACKKFLNFKGYKVWLNSGRQSYPNDIYIARWNKLVDFSFSLRDGLAGGSNSGYGALNLAVCFGANPIYLLGYDMRGEGGKQKWWHGGYPGNQGVKVYAKFIERFRSIAPLVKSRGFKVINLSPQSALKCFELGNFEDIKPIKRPVVISYYTRGTGYEDEVKKLINSLRRFNLEHDVEAVENRGSWDKNTHYKAEFIKAKLEQYKRAVLWVDADAVFQRYPFLFNDLDADIACHFRDYSQFPISRRKAGLELLSGTLYVDYNERCLELLTKWIGVNKNNPTVWEQRNLHRAIKDWDGKVFELPVQYCQIFDTMNDVEKPVITHFQASRRYRREVSA